MPNRCNFRGPFRWVSCLFILGILFFYQLIITFIFITRFNLFILLVLFLLACFSIFKIII